MKREDLKGILIRNERMSLTLVFSFFVFIILLSALIVSAGIVFLIEFLMGSEATLDTWLILVLMIAASAVIGSGLVFILSKFPLKPINQLINGMNRLATGDFSCRLEFKGVFYNNSTFREINDSFNRMAEDLGNTETLRLDFANNFSHEFKTPIMSIAGFARLLRQGNLTEEEREQYLAVIEDESRRLASMATSILKLTRVENQAILSAKSKVNISEQLRSAVLILEEKWTEKELDLDLGFDEYTVMADGELLTEAWINLVDNAVKYSVHGGKISISIEDLGAEISVSISNTGELIPEEKLDKIFRKFYQVDESHKGLGSGIGLAIVKRTVELHGGTVKATSAPLASQGGERESAEGMPTPMPELPDTESESLALTTFTVTLPKN